MVVRALWCTTVAQERRGGGRKEGARGAQNKSADRKGISVREGRQWLRKEGAQQERQFKEERKQKGRRQHASGASGLYY